MHAGLGTITCKFGSIPAICLREEAIFMKSQKCSYHMIPWVQAHVGTIVCKFGGDPVMFVVEVAICAKVYKTDGRTDRRTTRDCIGSLE